MGDSTSKNLVIYITKKNKCIPCNRALKYLKRMKLVFQVKYAEDEIDYFLWLTGGRTVVPLILNTQNGKLMIGCPTDFADFKREVSKLLS